MKLQSVPWLTGGVVASIFTFSSMAMANPNTTSSSFSISSEVRLTSAQEAQLEDLKARTISQLKNVLSSEQQAQLEESLKGGENFKAAIHSLDLSFRQGRQVRSIFGDVRSQLDTILTPEQKQQIGQAVQSQR